MPLATDSDIYRDALIELIEISKHGRLSLNSIYMHKSFNKICIFFKSSLRRTRIHNIFFFKGKAYVYSHSFLSILSWRPLAIKEKKRLRFVENVSLSAPFELVATGTNAIVLVARNAPPSRKIVDKLRIITRRGRSDR